MGRYVGMYKHFEMYEDSDEYYGMYGFHITDNFRRISELKQHIDYTYYRKKQKSK